MDGTKYLKEKLLDAMTGIKDVVMLMQDGEIKEPVLNLEQNEERLIRKALELYHSQKRAAKELGISRVTLRRKCEKYNIRISQ